MEHARALAASGGIGIAEALFESILDRAGVSAEADP
jgi:Rod binding domain-containing protein